jgi:hypothetical protein
MLNSFLRGLKSRAFFQPMGLAALFFALLLVRRSAQLFHPQIWAEDGGQVILGFIQHGWRSFALPVNGYLNTSSKLIMGSSLMLSSLYCPLVSTLLVWLFIIGVCCAIALCPTWLPARPLIAIATLLVPCDPEVFGIPLYAFWWASLLLFLVVLWSEKSSDIKWRLTFVLVGGLSSPIIFLITPFLLIRSLVLTPKRRERVILAAAVICCFIQSLMLRKTDVRGITKLSSLRLILPKFLGSYIAGNIHHVSDKTLWFTAGIVLSLLLATLPFVARQLKYWFLLGLWLGAMFFSAARVDLNVIHPQLAGPRYFFFPFVLLSWFVISVLFECDSKPLQLACAALLTAALLNTLPVLSRKHSDFRWADHLVSSSHFDHYQLPFTSNGYNTWYLFLDRAESQKLQNWGLINAHSWPAPKKTFPYRIISVDANALATLSSVDKRLLSTSCIVDDSWRGKDYDRSKYPGLTVIGSVRTGDADQGTLTVRLHRGDRVLFRTGPAVAHQNISVRNVRGFFDYAPSAPDWILLEFSNDLLPDEFTVVFSDKSSSFGEWSAAALRSSP